MSFYRHNNTGKYFIILESQLERFPTEPNRGDDIIKPFRKEVSETVGINSENANDFFPISRNYYESDKSGAEDPLSIIPDFQETLLKTIDSEEAKTSLETTSNSNMLGFRIKKGKLALDPGDPSWPTLLNQLSNDPENSRINKSVSKLLADNNLNSPDNPFVSGRNFNENNIILGTIQSDVLGEHAPRKYPNVVEVDPKNQATIEEMKQLGLSLLVASTGIEPTQLSETLESSQNLSLVDKGLKVNFSSMKPSTVMSFIKPGYVNSDNNDSVFDNSYLVDSYGNPNSPLKPFTGTLLQVNSPVMLGRIIAISFALKAIVKTFSLFGRSLGDHLTDGSSRNRQTFLGSNLGNSGSDAQADALDPFETPPIKNDFYTSVEAGFRQFFGLGTNLQIESIGNFFNQSYKTYGYMSMFLRKLNFAINQLNLAGVSNLVNTITNENTSSEPRKTAEEEVEKLRSNFAIKFIKILSIIGDKVLIVQNGQQQVGVPGIDGFISDIDGMPEKISANDGRLDPGILVVKHKLDSLNGSLAYGGTTLQSLLLIPNDIQKADEALNTSGENQTFKNAISSLQATNKIVSEANNDRISQADVKAMEDYLEMDYVPFYFHDLRTNEIISFHAFLESVTDNLSAEYNETEGYGRTGVIPIYKNTKRSINFSFKILATNEKDFEQMWYKVNRLAACLYPQYSEGRLLNYLGNKFIQPFSQVFAASPLMRIRFGDLWKSNYSKLGIARLFGLAGLNDGQNTTFQLATSRQVSVRSPTNRIRERQQQRNASTQTTRPVQVGDRVVIKAVSNKHTWAVASRDNNIMGNSTAISRAQARGQRIGEYIIAPNLFLYIPSSSGYVEGELIGIHRGNANINYFVRVTNSKTIGSGQLAGYILRGGITKRRSLNSNATNEIGEDPQGWIVCVNPGALDRIIPPPEPEITDPTVATETVNNSIPDFFKCDGDNPNPIMKAFCSTEGKGLACVLRSMNLEGITEMPWSVDKFDGRAPQILTVQMEITPIHDINPGLDSKGFMTAPIWPTGNIVNSAMGNSPSSKEGLEKFIQSRGKYIFPGLSKLGG
jgi:hypothetical protein